MPYLEQHGPQLVASGYLIIPITPKGKKPSGFLKDWGEIKATKETVERWTSICPQGSGVGVLTKHYPAVDLDILDPVIAEKMLVWIQERWGTKLYRVGYAPKVLIPFRTDRPFKKISSKAYFNFLDQKQQIEILGDGQQYVAFGTHPDTGKPYTWHNGSLEDVQADQLPILDPEMAQELIEYFYSIIPDTWEEKSKGTNPNLNEDDILLRYKLPLRDLGTPKIEAMLAQLDPDADYNQWVKVGMALFHQYNGAPEGLRLWEDWSSKGPKFQQGECRDKWPSFKANLDNVNPVTCKSLIHITKGMNKKKTEPSISNWMDADELDQDPEPTDFLVDNFIASNTIGVFFGAPGGYKSFVVFHIAMCVATGSLCFGNKVKQGPVVYVAGEGNAGFRNRYHAWKKHFGCRPKREDFHLSKMAFDFYNQESAQLVAEEVAMIAPGGLALVVIDTLARNFGQGNESDTADMNRFINNLDQLVRARFNCTILVVHHSGHKEISRGRGSSSLRGALDSEFMVKKTAPLVAKVKCTKMKDAEEPGEFYLKGEKVLLDFEHQIDSLVFEKTDSPVVEETQIKGKQLAVYKLILEMAAGEGQVDRKTLIDKAQEVGLLKNPEQFRKLLDELVKKGAIKADQEAVTILAGENPGHF